MALQIVRKYKWDNKMDLSLSRRCFYKNKRKISPKRRLLFMGWKTTTGCSESDLHRSQRRFTCHEHPHKISAQSDHRCSLIGALDEIWTEVPENWRQPFFFFFFFSRTLLSLSKDRSHPLFSRDKACNRKSENQQKRMGLNKDKWGPRSDLGNASHFPNT